MRWISLILLFAGVPLAAQDMESCTMHKEHMKQASQHQADVEKHGDQAMGFPHDKTTHHFRLYADGGAIEVTANDAKDDGNIQPIRSHLKHITMMFSQGDFSVPMFIHDQVPPGCLGDERETRSDFILVRRNRSRWQGADQDVRFWLYKSDS